MARLPQPGGDEHVWGDVLNDFLSQTLASDGSIKSGVVDNDNLASNCVSTAKIQNNAVATASIADGAVTAAKIASGVIPTSSRGIRFLSIFYSPPNIANGMYSNTYAAGYFSRFDDVVLGAGLQIPTDPYYASTVDIVKAAKALNSSIVFWGYIDAGVTSSNLPIATIKTYIDQWMTVGAGGIFLDLFGYDYHTSRSRQNEILDYIHSKNVGALINVWNSDDAFSSTVDATYNPSGTPTKANSSDVVLLESFVCNSDAIPASPHLMTMSDVKTRTDKVVAYRTSLGIRIFATNIMLHTGTSESNLNNYYGITEGVARACRLDGTGLSPSNYSSTGSDIGVVSPRRSSYTSLPFRSDQTYWLNNLWTKILAPDLGIVVDFSGVSWKQE